MLERLPGVDGLTATPEQAEKLVAAIRGKMSGLADPDVFVHDIRELVIVRGQYRTSIIVDPPDGRLPYTKAGLSLVAKISARNEQQFDNPEERPFAERCLENLGYPPIRTVPVSPSAADRADGGICRDLERGCARLAAVRRKPGTMPDSMRSIGGYSVGHWKATRSSCGRRTCEPTTLRETWPAAPCSWDRTAALPSGSRACRTRSSSIDTG